jgi:hypothetical protein
MFPKNKQRGRYSQETSFHNLTLDKHISDIVTFGTMRISSFPARKSNSSGENPSSEGDDMKPEE